MQKALTIYGEVPRLGRRLPKETRPYYGRENFANYKDMDASDTQSLNEVFLRACNHSLWVLNKGKEEKEGVRREIQNNPSDFKQQQKKKEVNLKFIKGLAPPSGSSDIPLSHLQQQPRWKENLLPEERMKPHCTDGRKTILESQLSEIVEASNAMTFMSSSQVERVSNTHTALLMAMSNTGPINRENPFNFFSSSQASSYNNGINGESTHFINIDESTERIT